MIASRTLTLIASTFVFLSVFYFSPGCKKTYITQITRDTTVINLVDSNTDRQVLLVFTGGSWGNARTTPLITPMRLYKFNKNNYKGVDSIVLMANPYMFVSDPYGDHTDSCVVALYDVTDSVEIAGSTLISNYESYISPFILTGNIYKALPSKEITLALTLKSTKDETNNIYTSAGVSEAFLFLFRK